MELEFGIIQELCSDPKDANGDPTTCKVIPNRSKGVVTQPLYIPFYWRGRLGNLQVDEEVCYAVKGNGQGVIISRLDGEWDGVIRNADTVIKAEGDIEIQGNTKVNGDIKTDGNVEATGDVKATGNVETSTGTVKGLVVQTVIGTKLDTHMHPTATPGPPSPPVPGS